jgi:cob(I)alamin adenosyltransferase
MKIYTKTGDDGSTGLVGGQRVRKSDARIECSGSVDELNAAIGLAAVSAGVDPAQSPPGLAARLHAIQHELFTIGSHLSSPDPAAASLQLPPLDDSIVARLEMEIDTATAALPPLRQFILPGGCETAARLHVARTTCRRAERVIVAFAEDRPVSGTILTYLNRLSDWLFVQARLANQSAGTPDVVWRIPAR